MPLTSSDTHTHHHGMLAGLGAGTAAVLVAAAFLASVWHRVSGTVAEVMTVLVWALLVAALSAVAYVVWFLALRARHHVTHPETLTRHAVKAEVIPARALAAEESPALPAPAPLPALPAPVVHNWNLNDPAAAAAAFRAITDSTTEGN